MLEYFSSLYKTNNCIHEIELSKEVIRKDTLLQIANFSLQLPSEIFPNIW